MNRCRGLYYNFFFHFSLNIFRSQNLDLKMQPSIRTLLTRYFGSQRKLNEVENVLKSLFKLTFANLIRNFSSPPNYY